MYGSVIHNNNSNTANLLSGVKIVNFCFFSEKRFGRNSGSSSTASNMPRPSRSGGARDSSSSSPSCEDRSVRMEKRTNSKRNKDGQDDKDKIKNLSSKSGGGEPSRQLRSASPSKPPTRKRIRQVTEDDDDDDPEISFKHSAAKTPSPKRGPGRPKKEREPEATTSKRSTRRSSPASPILLRTSSRKGRQSSPSVSSSSSKSARVSSPSYAKRRSRKCEEEDDVAVESDVMEIGDEITNLPRVAHADDRDVTPIKDVSSRTRGRSKSPDFYAEEDYEDLEVSLVSCL